MCDRVVTALVCSMFMLVAQGLMVAYHATMIYATLTANRPLLAFAQRQSLWIWDILTLNGSVCLFLTRYSYDGDRLQEGQNLARLYDTPICDSTALSMTARSPSRRLCGQWALLTVLQHCPTSGIATNEKASVTHHNGRWVRTVLLHALVVVSLLHNKGRAW